MGALLNFLDMQHPDGCISRAITPLKDHEPDPAKPVLCQMAARIVNALERQQAGQGIDWCVANNIYPRLKRFMQYHEAHYMGAHSLFKTHSALNSGYDNDPRIDGRPLNSIEEAGHNSFMKLDYDALAGLANRLSLPEAEAWQLKSQRLCELVNTLLWREPIAEGDGIHRLSGLYIALSWQHGVAGPSAAQREVIETPNWASMLPMYAGISTQQQADAQIQYHLLNPERYWSPFAGVRTMPADDPLFNQAKRVLSYDLQETKVTPVSNWCGPVWVLSNYYMFAGLMNYGYKTQAQELATITAQLLLHNLDETGYLYENYNDEQQGLWADQFCSWNVLSLTMLRESGLFPDLSIAA
jgi:putative isomerase